MGLRPRAFQARALNHSANSPIVNGYITCKLHCYATVFGLLLQRNYRWLILSSPLNTMRIGIFDSGIGGLVIARAIVKRLPQYDYVYLGDTQRVPYGNRSQETIYKFTREAVDYLFRTQNCALIIVACNTASTVALRRLQHEYLPKHFPKRRILGVIRPTAEAVTKYAGRRIGILATATTVASKAYIREIKKQKLKAVHVYQQAAPLLVPLLEQNAQRWLKPIASEYIRPLLRHKIDTLVLGCTHYPLVKKLIRATVGSKIKVLAQDEIIPAKLADYLLRHTEIAGVLSRRRTRQLLVTDVTYTVRKLARRWFGVSAQLKLVRYGHEV